MKSNENNGKSRLQAAGFELKVVLGPPDGPLTALRLLTPSGTLAILCGSGDHSENGCSPLPYRITTFSGNCRHSHTESKVLLKIQNLRFCVGVSTFCRKSDDSVREW